MKTLFTVIALGSVAFVSADSYGRPNGYRSGNCPSYNGGGYYQDQDQSSYGGVNYQEQPDYGNDNDQYSQQNPSYSQNQPYGQNQSNGQNQRNGQNQQYGQNQPYGQNQQYSQQPQRMNSNRNYANQNPNDQKVVSDQEIIKKIRNALSSGWFSKGFENVSFNVNNGNVNLTGSVDTLENKNKIEDSIGKIEGVRNVNNQITVVKGNSKTYSSSELQDSEKKYPQDFASTTQDKQLNARIREKLSKGWFSNGNKTLVLKTSDGIVIVSGTVDKPEDIQKVSDSINGIDGVRSVNNQMTVKNQ